MKKLVLLLVLAVFVSQGMFVFAQNSSTGKHESDYYYFSYPIETIYAHRLGFLVLYRRNSNQIARTYIPVEWFNTIGAKGEIVYLGTGAEMPTMTVYYKDGDFSHVRLRVRRSRTHETWGVIPFSANVDEYFKDIEEVKVDF